MNDLDIILMSREEMERLYAGTPKRNATRLAKRVRKLRTDIVFGAQRGYPCWCCYSACSVSGGLRAKGCHIVGRP